MDKRYLKDPVQVAVSEEGIRNDIHEGEKTTDISLASKLIQLEPFLTNKVVERLRNVKAGSLKSDVDDIPQIDQPNTIMVATLRDYQLRGVSWLVDRYDKGINCILADEMGLGKTLQTITFFTHLKDIRNISGPHLVVVPLSVLFNWISECRKFCPSLRLIRLHISKAERAPLMAQLSRTNDYDICITTYEMIKSDGMKNKLQSIKWRSVVLDEGHRVKNDQSDISKCCKLLKSRFKVILTGTPVQNNLGEMYSLLNFLMPQIFNCKDVFENCFSLLANNIQIDRDILNNAHYMLRPFVLRRLKIEVEISLPLKLETMIKCPLSEMQSFWIKRLLLKNGDLMQRLNHDSTHKDMKGTEWKKLQSLLAQLRKASNHPYLFPDAETDPGEEPTDEIVTASGKMVILDRLLVKLKEKGHRVVIFSQYTRTLDILDDYLNWRGYTHCRLDGQTNRVWREVLITEFNKPGNDTFVFCLSTRAGGEGVNLYTADTVILFDSDWNPQVDIQAMARVHRIGQTRPVHIYRLVSAGSVEERIVQRAQKKLFLDTMVNRGSSAMGLSMDAVVKEEGGGDTDDIDVSTAISALKFGWNSVFGVTESSGTQSDITYEDLEAIIDRKRGSGHIESLSKVMNEEKKGSSRNDNSSLLLEGQECDIKNFQEKTEFTSLRNFEGNIFENKTSSRRSDYYKAIDEEAVFQEGLKRARVSRLTEEYVSGVGMTAILKSNQYSLTQGEPSVFERETTSQRMKDVAAGLIQKSKRLKAGEDFMNQDHCQLCWEYGDLICCDHCPASYHVACLGLTAEDIPSMWSCPHHKACVDCGKNSKAAGFLFRCAMCPNAHCEDCMGNDQEILGNHPIWHEQGFKATGNCCYVNCSKECTEFFKAQNINKIK